LKDEIEWAEKKLSRFFKRGFTLFVTDLNVDDALIDTYTKLIDRIRSRGGRVIWFDHHPWGVDQIRKVARKCDVAIVGSNKEACATQIVQRELGLNGSFINRFVSLVHLIDFNLEIRDSRMRDLEKTYALSITYFNTLKSHEALQRNLRRIVDVLSEKRFVDKKMQRVAEEFERVNQKRMDRMFKSIQLIGSKIAIGFASGVQTHYACMRIQERTGRDVGMVIDPKSGRVSMRSKTSDVSKLARAFGGGGHKRASGFSIDPRKYNFIRSERDRIMLVDKINAEARRVGIK
jgi:oligoribonuclease NrnB/cAMP/cGMP phosphodiesterase (DHH superfamily)